MKTLKSFFLSLFIHIILGQYAFSQITPKDPDTFLIPNKDSLPQVFLVGCFHFEYYNNDAYKVEEGNQINILSEKKQQELKELLDYIAIFKPNKIMIEALPQWNAMKKYKQFQYGKMAFSKDERVQIGFKLAKRFNLDTLYSIDASSVADDLTSNKDSLTIRPYFMEMAKDYKFTANDNYNKYSDYSTKLSTQIPLLDYFKYLNSQKALQRDYGAYLLGDFKLGTYRGADVLAVDWYDRNLRIFRNIQRATTSPKDRILVLFGSGHIAILDQLFKATPEYNYIKFGELKK